MIDFLTNFLAAHAEIIITLVKIALLLFIVLTVNAYLTWFERKVVAHMQSRWGPHRVGPHGLLQPLADGAKFLLKEDPTPAGVDKFTYFLAPLMALALALTSIAIIPFGPDPIRIFGHDIYLGIVDLNIGLLALFAITALSVYGVALAGWSSNSKYPLLGGLRSSAQMVSYELALTMSVVGVLLMAGSFSLRDIVNAQVHNPDLGIFGWNIWPQILGFFCFFVAAIAETNRVPFDLPEAESELVAGFHTEYASFKFAMFFIAEYTSMITVSALCSIMFFGGWLSPFPASWTATHYLPSLLLIPFGLWVIYDGLRYETIFGRVILPGLGAVIAVLGILLIVFPGVNEFIQGPFWLLSKIFFFLFVYVWMRGTLPRFRYDQLMSFGWKLLLPVSLANVVITATFILFWGEALVTAPLLVFFVLAAMAVLGAISLILQRHPIHSALSLIVVMVALAGLYLLMGAEFVAAVQIIVYGGAIMVLFVFVIMLLNAGVEERTNFSKLATFGGIPLGLALLVSIAAGIVAGQANVQAAPQVVLAAPTKQLAGLLFQDFVYPFELTSFLILVAILGAIVLAQRENPDMVPTQYYLVLSAILFGLGVVAFIFRRNIITIFMSIELMLNAVNLAFVAFSQAQGKLDGQVFVLFVIVVAAAEAAVGLGIIILIARIRQSLNVERVDLLKL